GGPIAPVAGQPGRLDCQHRARRAGADRREQTLKAGTDLTTARTAEIFVNDNDRLPAELVCPCDQRILSPAALGIVEQLIRRRLPNIDISFARQVLRRNLIHCWPRPTAPRGRRGAPPSAASEDVSPLPESVVVFGSARARWPRAREDRAAGGRRVAPSSHVPLIIVEDDDDRSAPSIALRSACNASNVSRGLSMIVRCAAHGSVIQAGNSARGPSGCPRTQWKLAACCNGGTTATRLPTRGCSGYWIRTSKGCSWAVCRCFEGHDERDGAVSAAATLARGLAPEGAAWRAVLHCGGRLPQS